MSDASKPQKSGRDAPLEDMSSNADGDIPRSGPWNEAGYCFLALAFQVHRKGPSVTVPRFWVGVTLAVAAAVLLSGASVSAVIAYGEGANPTSVAGIRFIGPIILLYALLRLTGAPIRLERRDRSVALGLGAVQAAQSYCLYSSFEHIPVGLTMIIFYIYPAVGRPDRERDRAGSADPDRGGRAGARVHRIAPGVQRYRRRAEFDRGGVRPARGVGLDRGGRHQHVAHPRR